MLNYTALFDQGKGIQVTSLCWPCCASALSPASLADAAVLPGVAGLRAPSLNSSPFSLGGEGVGLCMPYQEQRFCLAQCWEEQRRTCSFARDKYRMRICITFLVLLQYHRVSSLFRGTNIYQINTISV